MIKVKLFDPSEERKYTLPNKGVYSREEILALYPAMEYEPTLYITEENTLRMSNPMYIQDMCRAYGVSTELSLNDAIIALEDIINNPPEIEQEPTPEERIAASLELQTMLSMPDII